MTALIKFSERMVRSFALLLFCALALSARLAGAQTVNASLGGIVSDATGARLNGASVTLLNDKSHDERKSRTNSKGVFQFNAVPTGTYTLTVVQQGFETLHEKGIELHPNDVRAMDELKLQVGEVSETMDVTANDEVPTSGERSTLITANDISRLSTVGRDVSELLKTQAGFAVLQSGLDNGGSSDASVVGTGGAGLGNYVGNGSTGNGASVISDGANVTDPGNGSGQTQTVNMDMVAEVKIETSNFGADTAKGPTVITAVGKSGGANFHGSVYAFGRTSKLNAEDWYLKFVGLPPIQDHYVYPGFNISGPVLIPGTHFNHNKKLTFFLGAEDYIQRNVYAYGSPLKSFIQALVPTDTSTNTDGSVGMRQGNFSQAELANYIGSSVLAITGNPSTNTPSQCTATGTLVAYLHVCGQPNASPGTNGKGIVGGQFIGGAAGFDPGAAALLKEFPLPTGPTINGYNWSALNLTNPDVYQARTRIDYSFNDANKLYGVFNTEQSRTTGIPEQIYYSPASGGTSQGGLDTPGKVTSTGASNTASANFTHIFNANATNEIFGAVSYVSNFYNSGNPNALSKAALGYPYQGVYTRASCKGCGSADIPQLATYSSVSDVGLPLAITPDFSDGRYISKKFLPSGGDNFSYLIKAHTLKFGTYIERDTANQTDLSPITNGQLSSYYLSSGSFNDAACQTGVNCHAADSPSGFTGQNANYLADFLLGDIGTFQQQNFNPQTNLYYWTISWFATDSWKATKRLTIDYGIRFDHLGPWNDAHGLGIATFSPTLYASDVAAGVNGANLPGVRWHGGAASLNTSAATPVSGSKARFAFYSPRFGLAYDAFGTGRTILRGGLGFYRAHDSWNDYQPSAATAEGLRILTVGGSGAISLAGVDAGASTTAGGAGLLCNASATSACPSISALDPNDDQQPLTETYSFTVTQQMPRNLVFEIAYVGNQSHDLLTDAGSTSQQADLQNVNALPLGALFLPDPNPKSMAGTNGASNFGVSQQPDLAGVAIQDDYRKYTEYTNVLVPRHVTYANYNALQVSLNRQKGALNFGLNYTWSRAQGVRGGYNNGLSQDATNFRANYGPLAFDRTNIANLSYSYDEGQHFHFGRFANGL